MISLIQTANNLIGSEDDIKALAEKKSPRLLIISDSHGKIQILSQIIEQYGPACDALVFCGDGASDLVTFLNNANSNKKILKKIPPVIAFVRGNGDSSRYTVNFGNKILEIPSSQVLTANHKNFYIVHGHNQGINWGFEQCGMEAQFSGCNRIFYGHTHITAEETVGDFTFVNPGSCSRPRGGQPACFAIATVESRFVDIAHIKIESGLNGTTKYSIFTPIY